MKKRRFHLFTAFLLTSQLASAQWASVNSPALPLTMRNIVTAGNVMFATTFPDQIYRSLDNGTTWQLADNGLPDDDIWSTLEGTPTGEVYLGTANRRVYKSLDGGDNWVLAGSLSTNSIPDIEDLAINNGKIYTASGGKIQRSDDQGQTWTTIGTFTGSTNHILLHNDKIFVTVTFGPDAGLYCTSDEGGNWQKISYGYMDFIVCIGAKGDRIFAQSSGPGKLYFTDDLGANWTEITSWPKETFLNSFFLNGADLYACGEGGIYKTLDDGMTWQFVNGGFPYNTDSDGMTVAPNGDLLGATARGIFKSADNAATWSLSSNGIPTERIWVQDIAGFSSEIFIAGKNSFFASDDDGNNWQEYSQGLPSAPATDYLAEAGGNLFGGGFGTLVKLQNDHTWLNLSDSLPFNAQMTIATNGTDLFIATLNRIYQSADGIEWQKITPSSNAFYTTQTGFHDNYIFAGSGGQNLNRAEIGTTNWESVSDELIANTGINGMLSAGDTLLIYGYKDAFFSTNNGESWHLFDIPCESNSGVRLMYRLDDALIAVLNDCILMSIDGGANWLDKSEGLPTNIFASNFLKKNGFLYLASNDGVYRVAISDLYEGFSEINFTGEPYIFPNPSSGPFFIQAGEVSLYEAQMTVTDALGRLIMTEKIDNPFGKYYFEMPNPVTGIYQVSLTKGDWHWASSLFVR